VGNDGLEKLLKLSLFVGIQVNKEKADGPVKDLRKLGKNNVLVAEKETGAVGKIGIVGHVENGPVVHGTSSKNGNKVARKITEHGNHEINKRLQFGVHGFESFGLEKIIHERGTL